MTTLFLISRLPILPGASKCGNLVLPVSIFVPPVIVVVGYSLNNLNSRKILLSNNFTLLSLNDAAYTSGIIDKYAQAFLVISITINILDY